jgi:hypothetical protein
VKEFSDARAVSARSWIPIPHRRSYLLIVIGVLVTNLEVSTSDIW